MVEWELLWGYGWEFGRVSMGELMLLDEEMSLGFI